METLEQTKDRNIRLTLIEGILKRNDDENEYQSDTY